MEYGPYLPKEIKSIKARGVPGYKVILPEKRFKTITARTLSIDEKLRIAIQTWIDTYGNKEIEDKSKKTVKII
jgi:hypothetical protein